MRWLKFGRNSNESSQETVWSGTVIESTYVWGNKIIKQEKEIESTEEYIILKDVQLSQQTLFKQKTKMKQMTPPWEQRRFQLDFKKESRKDRGHRG